MCARNFVRRTPYISWHLLCRKCSPEELLIVDRSEVEFWQTFRLVFLHIWSFYDIDNLKRFLLFQYLIILAMKLRCPVFKILFNDNNLFINFSINFSLICNGLKGELAVNLSWIQVWNSNFWNFLDIGVFCHCSLKVRLVCNALWLHDDIKLFNLNL